MTSVSSRASPAILVKSQAGALPQWSGDCAVPVLMMTSWYQPENNRLCRRQGKRTVFPLAAPMRFTLAAAGIIVIPVKSDAPFQDPSAIHGFITARDQLPVTNKPDDKEESGRGPDEEREPRFVVGIAASAGGLAAFQELLKGLPAKTGMAYVIIQHLDPQKKSILPQLLSKSTSMPVHSAENGQKIEADHVYVIPPNADMGIFHGNLTLVDREQKSRPQMTADYFLRSLAQDQGKRAIGVILSGAATDGTLGLTAVKAENGITFVQDPKSTDYDGMPTAAIQAGVADFIGTPYEIGQKMLEIAEHPFANRTKAGDQPALPESDLDDLDRLFLLVRNATGADFSLYKRSTVGRRIDRRMMLLKITDLGDYIHYIKDNPEEAHQLFQDLLIRVTSFFRDPETFEFLKKKIYPKIMDSKDEGNPWRVWVPGCATGEEAYSLAISLLEFFEENTISPGLQIFATDINEAAIKKARQGIYPDAGMEGVSRVRLQKYFQPAESGYAVRQYIREQSIFSTHDITRDPPFSRIDLVSFRNVLIYLDSVLQKRVIPVLYFALQPQGYLVLGSSETVFGHPDLLKVVDKKHRIFAKKAAPSNIPLPRHLTHHATGARTPVMNQIEDISAKPGAADFMQEADNVVLNDYSPPGVIIDGNMDVIQFRGRTGRYLEHNPGRASFNVLDMAREGLGAAIRTALFEARKERHAISKSGIRVRIEGESVNIKLDLIPLKVSTEEEHFLILFEEFPTVKKSLSAGEKAKAGKSSDEIIAKRELEQVRQDLDSTRQYLHSMVEEKDQNNEELRAANEEIQSSNEELQSINEELETTKEELQSTNEELTTVNDELAKQNQELTRTNDDLTNLLDSVDTPIVILDYDMKIRRYTPAAEKMLNMIPGDVGRPISDINMGLNIKDLSDKVYKSIDSMTYDKQEVQNRDGVWYLMQLWPYKTSENKIEGVIISFTDVDELKRSLEKNRRDAQLSHMLNKINLEINSTHQIDDILATVIDIGMEAVSAEAAAVIVKAGKKWKVRISQGLTPEPYGETLTDSDLPGVVKAIRKREPLAIEELSRAVNGKAFASSEYGVKSLIAIPLMVRGEKPWGAIEFYRTTRKDAFDELEVDFAAKLSASVSLALDNAEMVSTD
jgi:two-component system CheB/CheR fusion protein